MNPAPMKKRILLVDDDSGVRQMLMRLLTLEDYHVLPAANGEEALQICATNEVDLVLLDLNLPKQSGWDIFERLTTDNPLLPFIIITARPNQLFLALGAGAGALLEKPLDFPELLRTMKSLLAESPEVRLARMAGNPTEFHYRPKTTFTEESGPHRTGTLARHKPDKVKAHHRTMVGPKT